jgi:hypothetical protein
VARPGAQVQQWTFTPTLCRMSYSLTRNRFCENVRRPHKSNRVNIICDLARGVWRQRCMDADCASYRAQEWRLPMDLYQEALARLRTGSTSAHEPGDVASNASSPLPAEEGLGGRSWAVQGQSEKERREGARAKVSASMAALVHLKEMMLNGSLDDAARQVSSFFFDLDSERVEAQELMRNGSCLIHDAAPLDT